MTHSARPTLFLRVMRLQLLLGATSSLEMSISTLDAALPDFELKLPPCHQRDELPSLTIQPTALFSLQTSVPTKQPKINQPTNDPSCRPSFRPSNQLHCCKASIALNQPPIITNLRTLQAPGSSFWARLKVLKIWDPDLWSTAISKKWISRKLVAKVGTNWTGNEH